MRKALLSSFIVLSFPVFSATYREVHMLMGTRFELVAVAQDLNVAKSAVELGIREISRIERLISSWDPNSQTSEINRNAGIAPVTVDRELLQLIKRSLKISKLTNGAFDISFAAIDKIWSFEGQIMKALPDEATIRKSVSKIDYRKIKITEDQSSVYLLEKGMKIGFGGIGKGYAANRAMKVMKSLEVTGVVVDASGDLMTWGENEDEKAWNVGITNPDSKEDIVAVVPLGKGAVVTSGDYEKFFYYEDKRYSHIINPTTGYPTSGIKSVTVLCPDAEIADALATSVFVMGKDEGLSLINSLSNIEVLVITDDNLVHSSEGLKVL